MLESLNFCAKISTRSIQQENPQGCYSADGLFNPSQCCHTLRKRILLQRNVFCGEIFTSLLKTLVDTWIYVGNAKGLLSLVHWSGFLRQSQWAICLAPADMWLRRTLHCEMKLDGKKSDIVRVAGWVSAQSLSIEINASELWQKSHQTHLKIRESLLSVVLIFFETVFSFVHAFLETYLMLRLSLIQPISFL